MIEDHEKDPMDLDCIELDLRLYFDKRKNKSMIKVKDIIFILIPYIREARQNKYISYTKTISEFKKLNVPIKKFDWDRIIDKAIIDELDKKDEKEIK